jgi:hypothetical protein
LDINEAHDEMVHLGERMFRTTYTDMIMALTTSLKLCDGCPRAEAKLSATEALSPSVVDKEETTAEQGTTIMQQVHYVDNAVVMSEPGTPATTDGTLSGPKKKKWRESAIAEINKKIMRKERRLWKTTSQSLKINVNIDFRGRRGVRV